MINKVDHIGIAVKNLEEAAKIYTQVLGLKLDHIEIQAEQKVRVAMIPVGESEIELLEATDPESSVAKFIEKRGEGLHHIAVGVTDIASTLEDLKARGVTLIDQTPRDGAGDSKIAFIHPRESKILLELVERKSD